MREEERDVMVCECACVQGTSKAIRKREGVEESNKVPKGN